jgi:hypothetical protein
MNAEALAKILYDALNEQDYCQMMLHKNKTPDLSEVLISGGLTSAGWPTRCSARSTTSRPRRWTSRRTGGVVPAARRCQGTTSPSKRSTTARAAAAAAMLLCVETI